MRNPQPTVPANQRKRSLHYNRAGLALMQRAVTYRIPLPVTECFRLENGEEYPLCPRCRISIDREYMSFCDRCGQLLDWQKYDLEQTLSSV